MLRHELWSVEKRKGVILNGLWIYGRPHLYSNVRVRMACGFLLYVYLRGPTNLKSRCVCLNWLPKREANRLSHVVIKLHSPPSVFVLDSLSSGKCLLLGELRSEWRSMDPQSFCEWARLGGFPVGLDQQTMYGASRLPHVMQKAWT